MTITHRIQATSSSFETKICNFLMNNFEANADSEGKRDFEKHNAATQLDYMMSYVNGDKAYIKKFANEGEDFKKELTKFLSLSPPAQHARLLKHFKKLT